MPAVIMQIGGGRAPCSASPYQVATTNSGDLETALQTAITDMGTDLCDATVEILYSATFALSYTISLADPGMRLTIDATQVRGHWCRIMRSCCSGFSQPALLFPTTRVAWASLGATRFRCLNVGKSRSDG